MVAACQNTMLYKHILSYGQPSRPREGSTYGSLCARVGPLTAVRQETKRDGGEGSSEKTRRRKTGTERKEDDGEERGERKKGGETEKEKELSEGE